MAQEASRRGAHGTAHSHGDSGIRTPRCTDHLQVPAAQAGVSHAFTLGTFFKNIFLMFIYF